MPIIAINPIPGQEEQNAEYLEKNKLAIWIRKNDNIEEKLKEILNDDKKLQQIKENTIKFGKPNAAKNICEIILK